MLLAKFRKTVAVFFLLLMVESVVTPCVSYALTAGPTAPEATSFEPVDTTDLVDLKSGDFTYNLPLLEVPGPAGGYPFSLSYHAGILPEVEASWVGLGFTLNPGSITRFVNGYPDDHRIVGNVTREFWEGEKTTTATVGVSFGVANAATVSADLQFANNTYKGRGVGFGAGFNLGYQFGNAQLSVGGYGGVSPYGQSYSNVGISVGIGESQVQQIQMQGRIGLSMSSQSKLNASAGGSMSLLNASISSSSSTPSFSVTGIPSMIHQHNSGKVSSVSDSWQAEIPLYYVNLRLGRSYARYWIDETDHALTYGSLYLGQSPPSLNVTFDTYDIADTEIDYVSHSDGEKVLGGSFPDVDSYTVTGQGIGGSIQPYHFQQELYRQDKKDRDGKVLAKSYELGANAYKKTAFRFVNDFSNRFEYTPDDFTVTDELTFAFTGAPVTGKSGSEAFKGNHLAGSKHVEWYSNRAILGNEPGADPFGEGFVNAVAEGFVRDNNDQIGGYSITNSSGVTYHYALPAYSFGEVMKSQNTKKQEEESGLYYNEVKKPEKYAHTWHLTSVTGPDYVDRNSNGLADHGDWGYWVRYDYKKWIADYKWRNPGEGFNKDLDSDFDFYAYGKKELYHLAKIVTETHVALFLTSERKDGREVASLATGGFAPTPITNEAECYEACASDCYSDPACEQRCEDGCRGAVSGHNVPRAVFKLDEIKLFNYETFSKGQLEDGNVLRSIKFNYDYSLAPGTPNSYNSVYPFEGQGKLTLKSVVFLGKGRVEVIPPVDFYYSKNPSYQKDFADMWGFYKSDYVANDNKNIATLTTPVSAQNVDAWSLTSITTSLGSEIEMTYESDEYKTPVLYRNNLLSIESMTVNETNHSIVLNINPSGFDLTKMEDIIRHAELELLLKQVFKAKEYCICDNGYRTSAGISMGNFYSRKSIVFNSTNVLNVTPTSIELSDDDLYSVLTTEVPSAYYNETPCIDTSSKRITPEIRILPGALVSGNVVVQPNLQVYGGGLRVKKLAVKSDGEESVTSYIYRSGVTTYEPVNFGKIDLDFGNWPATEWTAELNRIKLFKEDYLRKMYKSFSGLLAVARLMPGPGVLYKEVEVRQTNKTSDGTVHELPNYLVYKFEEFNDGMIGFLNQAPQTTVPSPNPNYKEIKTRSVILKDYTARIGNLRSVTMYDINGNPITSTENQYLHDGLDGSFDQNRTSYEHSLLTGMSNQGVIEQSFVRAKIILYKYNEPIPYPTDPYVKFFQSEQKHLLGIIAKKETFPSVQTGQLVKNFKTGIVSKTENIEFDFYSGEPLKIKTSDSYGNAYWAVTIPAYEKYSGMGLKVNDKKNKNMLTQSTAQYSYLLGENNTPDGLLSALVQTWSNAHAVVNDPGFNGNIWRKQSAFAWDGDQDLDANNGTYPIADFESHKFKWHEPSTSTGWLQTSTVTQVDKYSNVLEAMDMNENYAATRMDNKGYRVIASAANSAYHEMAYSGAEYYSGNTEKEGGVDRGSGIPSPSQAHTGNFSLLVGQGMNGFNYVINALPADGYLTRKYRASVWVYAPGNSESEADLKKIELFYVANGQEKKFYPVPQKNKSKEWYLLNIDIDPQAANQVSIGVRNNSQRAVYFDDFRVHPLDASLTSFVYDDFSGELTHILDNNNLYTRFEYDAMGRLIRSTKEQLNFDFGDGKESFKADAVLKEVKYNFGKE